MVLLAEGEFWLWAAKMADPAFITSLGALVAIVLKHFKDEKGRAEIKEDVKGVKEDVKDNTELCKQVVPAVDSATKKMEVATETAEKVVGTAAAKMGEALSKQIGERAENAAVKLAEVTAGSQKVLVESVANLSKKIHGEDGTCVVGRLGEQARQIGSLDQRVSNLESDVALVKGDTKQILEILRTK